MNLLNNLYISLNNYIAPSYDDAVTKMNQYHFTNGQFGLVYYYTDSSAVESLIGVPGFEDNDKNITFCSEANKITESYISQIQETVKKSISSALIYNCDISTNLNDYKEITDSSIENAYLRIQALEEKVDKTNKNIETLIEMFNSLK